MNNFNFLGKLIMTYLVSLVASLFTLFLLMVPASAFLGFRDGFPVVIVGLIIAFFYLGFLSITIYLPILLVDKRIGEFDIPSLMKRYLPWIALVLALIFLVFLDSHTIYEPLGYSYIYIYLVSMISLYVFCRTIVTRKE